MSTLRSKLAITLSIIAITEIISLGISPAALAKPNNSTSPSSATSRSTSPAPSILDLTTKGSSGQINGGLFEQITDNNPAGTGVIDSFVRIHALGNSGNEQGYNTDYRAKGGDKLQFDENSSPQFTRSLLLSDVPIITKNDIKYRQFILDINEPNAKTKPIVTLDSLKIFLGNAPDLTNYSSTDGFGKNASLIYNLDQNKDNQIKLFDLNSGSGRYDMFAYIPDSYFQASTNPYVYLYSSFQGNTAQGGFEEWAVGRPKVIVEKEKKKLPEPSTFTGIFVATLGLLGLSKKRKQDEQKDQSIV